MQAVLFCNITFYEFQVLLNRMDGKLTEAQRIKLEKHPLQSATLMEAAGFMDPHMIKAIRQHHERPDGSGYPNHLPSKDISTAVPPWFWLKQPRFLRNFSSSMISLNPCRILTSVKPLPARSSSLFLPRFSVRYP